MVPLWGSEDPPADTKVIVTVSMLEIYNERLRDLLSHEVPVAGMVAGTAVGAVPGTVRNSKGYSTGQRWGCIA